MMRINRIIVKTKSGKTVRTVREHYLREDLVCGSSLCINCVQCETYLEREPVTHSTLFTVPQYIIPDTDVLMHQIDVLGETVFTNVVIPQTVPQELGHHSPAYNKVKEILGNADRHFYTFVNEHHKDTFVEREPGESANDRNDRAIRKAVKWYQDHLSFARGATYNMKIILLTNDRANAEQAEKEGIEVHTFYDYVKSLTKYPSLADKLGQISSHNEGELVNSKDLFTQHMPLSKIQESIKCGKLHQGKFQASRKNYLEGYVFIGGEDESEAKSVFIQVRENLNRAVHGDVVRILPEEEWCYPSSLVLEDKTKYADEENEVDEEAVTKTRKQSSCKVTGVVVGIIKRNWRPYCGILQPPCVKESTPYLFAPADRCIPEVRIEAHQGNLLSKRVSIDGWPRDSRYPQSHFVRVLGDVGDKDTENKILLLEHDIPHQPFSKAVLDCLPQLSWIITEDVKVRKDLRHLFTCSVDPPGCTDINDALHCRRLDNGHLEVGVHIANLFHFIRPSTPIDKEDEMRGRTVYLVDKRIDMVPDLLSSNLCSLKGNEDGFAFTVIWEMDDEAHTLQKSFLKSVLKSKAALIYAEAQIKIDDKSQNDEHTISLRLLSKLAKLLKRQRIGNRALSLASTEVRFAMDTETHDPIDVEKKELKETNSMVEQFMILGNISVAERILEEFPD